MYLLMYDDDDDDDDDDDAQVCRVYSATCYVNVFTYFRLYNILLVLQSAKICKCAM